MNLASERTQQAKTTTSTTGKSRINTTITVPYTDYTVTGTYDVTSACLGGSTTNLEPVSAASVLGENPSGGYRMSQGSFSNEPKTELSTGIEGSQVPSAGDAASSEAWTVSFRIIP